MEFAFTAENLAKPWFRAIVGIILVIAGIVCVTSTSTHPDITREDCIEAEVTLYDLRADSNRIGNGNRGMWLIFDDYDSFSIHSSCGTDELVSAMFKLKKGTKMTILHTENNGNIYGIWVNGECLLDFDTAKEKIDNNVSMVIYAGYILLPAGAILAVSALFGNKKNKKAVSDEN